MAKRKIVLTRRWPDPVERRLAAAFDVELNAADEPMSAGDLQSAMRSAEALCPTVSDAVTAAVIGVEDARVQIIGNYGVGFNHIDIAAAKKTGVVVTNTPGVLTDCTADLAMTLLLMVARGAGAGERHVRRGEWTGWRPTHMMGTKVSGKTLGLVGFGRIAQAMARKAHFGFGMRIVFHTPRPPAPAVADEFEAVQCDSLEDLLHQSDFVSLHCPGTEHTHHLIDATRLAQMPAHAYLINSARGDVVDQDALIEALSSGRIRGAGLDVFENEPAIPDALRAMNNVVLLPHLGSATLETRIAMGMRVVDNLEAFFASREPRDRVG